MANDVGEPSLEDILASIKKVIAEDGRAARLTRRRPTGPVADPVGDPPTGMAIRPVAAPETAEDIDSDDAADDDDVLELTQSCEATGEDVAVAADGDAPVAAEDAGEDAMAMDESETESEADTVTGEDALISDAQASAMRSTLAALSVMAEPGAKPQIVRSGETSLEGLVREMLKPMLADWLAKNMPDMVEAMVSREIARIVGRKA